MDDTIRDLIDSPEVDDRKRAVKLLAKDGSNEALKLLAVIYKTDTDAEIRDLAVKAGRYIKKQQEEAKWAGSPAVQEEVVEEEESAEEEPEYIKVSSMAEERAKGLIDQAMDVAIRGDKPKALEMLRKAFKANPNLRHDSFSMSIATDITGMGRAETLDLLMNNGVSGGKTKRKNGEVVEEVTTGEAITDLVIYTLVTAAVFIVGVLLCFQLVSQPLGQLIADMQRSMPPQGTMRYAEAVQSLEALQALHRFTTSGGIVASLIIGGVAGIWSLINLLLQYLCIHVAATMLLGGTGTFTGLIRKVTMFQTGLTVFYAIVCFVGIAVLMNGVANAASNPAIMQSASSGAASGTDAAMASMSGLFCISGVGMLVFFLGVAYYFCRLIGQAYDFGTGKGCLTLFVSGILLSILNSILQGTMQGALQNMIAGSMTR